MHLGDAHLGGDLGLREPLAEPELEDALFPLRQTGQQGAQGLALLDQLQAGVSNALPIRSDSSAVVGSGTVM